MRGCSQRLHELECRGLRRTRRRPPRSRQGPRAAGARSSPCQLAVSSFAQSLDERPASSPSRCRTRSGFVGKRGCGRPSSGIPNDLAHAQRRAGRCRRDDQLAVPRREHLVPERPSGTRCLDRSGSCRRRGSPRGGNRRTPSAVSYSDTSTTRSCARALALEQRGQRSRRRPHSGAHVDQPRADAHTGAARLARHPMSPPAACMSASYPGSRASGPTLPVRADRAVDEPWVMGRARPSAPSPSPRRDRGRRLCRKTSALLGERSTASRPRSSRERDRERALAGVGGEEHRALAVPERRPPCPAVVPRARPLDLDDVGAERTRGSGRSRARRSTSSRRRRASRRAAGAAWRHHRRSRLRGCAACGLARLRSDHGLGLGRVVEPTRSSSLVSIVDAFFPVVPSESIVIIGGALASSGDLSLPLVILAGATGAIVGDNISYWIGRWAASTRSSAGSGARGTCAASTGPSATGGTRRVHHPHRALHPLRSHRRHVHLRVHQGRPWRRFLVADVVAGVLWATYAAMLGYIGGKQFQERPLGEVLLALGVASRQSPSPSRWSRHRRARAGSP